MSTNYLSKNIDRPKLLAKLSDFKSIFRSNFELSKHFFRKCHTALAHSPHKDFIPILDNKVIDHIEAVPSMQELQNEFNLFEYLNYKKNIAGIKIPLSYGATIHTSINLPEEQEPKKPTHTHKLILQFGMMIHLIFASFLYFDSMIFGLILAKDD